MITTSGGSDARIILPDTSFFSPAATFSTGGAHGFEQARLFQQFID